MNALDFTLGLNARQFLSGLSEGASAVRGFASNAIRSFSETGGVVGNVARGARVAIGGIGSSIGSVISGMHNLNGAVELVGRGVSTLQSMASKVTGALDLAGDLEQTRTAFRVMIGDATKANAVISDAKQLADESPYSDKEILGGTRALIAYGEASETVVESMRRIGDVASGVNQPIGEIADIYGKARVQGTLFAEDINQLTGRGIPVLQQFASQLGIGVDQVKQMASEGKVTFTMLEQAFKDMTSAGGQFNGMMAEQSTTYKGLMSTLEAGWDNVKIAFATPLLESLKPILEDGISLLDGMQNKAEGVGKSIADWISYMTAAFKAGEGWNALMLDMKIGLLEVVNYFGGKLSGMFDWVGDQADELVSGLTVMMAKLNPMMSSDEYDQFVETAADDLDKKKKARADKTAAGPFSNLIEDLKSERTALIQKVDPNKDQREAAQVIGQEIAARNALANAQNAGRDFALDQKRQEALDLAKIQGEEMAKVQENGEVGKAAEKQTEAAKTQATAAQVQLTAAKKLSGEEPQMRGHIKRLDAAEILGRRYDRMSSKDKVKVGGFDGFLQSARMDLGSMDKVNLGRLRSMSTERNDGKESAITLALILTQMQALGKNIGAI